MKIYTNSSISVQCDMCDIVCKSSERERERERGGGECVCVCVCVCVLGVHNGIDNEKKNEDLFCGHVKLYGKVI